MNIGGQDFWKPIWEEKAKVDDEMSATGGRKSVTEFLHTTADVASKLQLNSEDILADIGCSIGLMALTFAPFVKRILAIDYSPEMVKRASHNLAPLANVEVYVGNVLNLPLEDAFCSKVLCWSVIQYLGSKEELYQAFAELKRIIKRDGLILVSAIPNVEKRDEYLRGIERLNLPPERKEDSLRKNAACLWLHPKEVVEMAAVLELKNQILPLPATVWPSWYMFDVLMKV